MNRATTDLLQRVARAVRAVPRPVLEPFCRLLEDLPPNPSRSATGAVLRSVTQQAARDVLTELVSFWRRAVPTMRADQLAWALRAASITDEERVQSQSIELVWTGPVSGQTTLRRTEQALLEVIEGARWSIILVTFAAYKIPHISDALLAAARRDVRIVFIAESPDASAGKIAFAGFRALGEPLARQAKLYIWPHDRRMADAGGHVGSLHAKCAVADEDALFISSANLTDYALTLNMELGVLIRGGDMPRQAGEQLRELIHSGTLAQVLP